LLNKLQINDVLWGETLMSNGNRVVSQLTALTVVLAIASLGAQAEIIGGTTPDRRPEGAPKATKGGLDAGERAKALAGVSEPFPPSLKFLDDQGGWFTPFSHPGMTGPYDIRKWHKKPAP
jgi:hypothetical protein